MTTSIENAMFMAAKAGYVDDIKEILNTGKGDWNVTDSLGNTPLHYAAGNNSKTFQFVSSSFSPSHKNQFLCLFFVQPHPKLPFFDFVTKKNSNKRVCLDTSVSEVDFHVLLSRSFFYKYDLPVFHKSSCWHGIVFKLAVTLKQWNFWSPANVWISTNKTVLVKLLFTKYLSSSFIDYYLLALSSSSILVQLITRFGWLLGCSQRHGSARQSSTHSRWWWSQTRHQK